MSEIEVEPGPFIKQMNRSFGTEPVTVIADPGQPNETRYKVLCQLQGRRAFFDVNAPIYEGSRLEFSDPRGGVRSVWITQVKVNKAPARFPAHMGHIAADFAEHAPVTKAPPANHHNVFHGDAVVILGDGNNVATQGSQINQATTVAPGYEGLAQAVRQALTLLEETVGFDEGDREIGREAGAAILSEVSKTSPDTSKLRRPLATLRGVFAGIVNAAASAATSKVVQELVLPNLA